MKKKRRFIAILLVILMTLSVIPDTSSVYAAKNSSEAATATESDAAEAREDTEEADLEEKQTDEITESDETGIESAEVETDIEESAQTEEKDPEESTAECSFIEFDHSYTNVDTSVISTSDLFVKTSDDGVFTKNTNVISNYDDVYIISFDSVEEAGFAYTYYYDKVDYITDLSNAFGLADEGAEDTEDVADMSEVNISSNDAIANLNDIPAGNYSGYIALIDSGANADVNLSVLGGDTSDNVGHGSRMLQYIREENPGAKVLSIKAFDGYNTNAADVYAAIKLAIESHVAVINLSFTGLNVEKNSILKDIINEALGNGITVIGAAGNTSGSAKNYIPGCIGNVITVGAVNEDGTLYKTSNYDADIYVVAESTSEATARYSAIYLSGSKSDKIYEKLSAEPESKDDLNRDDDITLSGSGNSWNLTSGQLAAIATAVSGYSVTPGSTAAFSSFPYWIWTDNVNWTSTAAAANKTFSGHINRFTSNWQYCYTAAGASSDVWYSFSGSQSASGNWDYIYDTKYTLSRCYNLTCASHIVGENLPSPLGTHDSGGVYYYYAGYSGDWAYYVGFVHGANDMSIQSVGSVVSISTNPTPPPPPARSSITMHKTSSSEYKPSMEGIVYGLYYGSVIESQLVGEYVLNSQGIPVTLRQGTYIGTLGGSISGSYFSNLPAGTYYIKEKSTNSNYQINSATYTRVLSSSTSETVDITASDTPVTYSVTMVKDSAVSFEPSMDGIEYTLYKNSTCTDKIGTLILNSAGKVKSGTPTSVYNNGYITGLIPGTYYLKETKTNGNYVMNDKVYVQTIASGSTNVQYTISVEDNPEVFVSLKKSSGNSGYTSGNPNYSLAGAEYKVFTSSVAANNAKISKDYSAAIGTLTTDSKGDANNIDVSEYMLKNPTTGTFLTTALYVIESKAPKNYQLDTSTHTLEVKASNTSNNPAVLNVSDLPVDDPVRVQVRKVFPDGEEVALEGAVFTLKFYPEDIDENYTYEELQQFTPTIIKTYKTEKLMDGTITTNINELLPIGYVTLEETTPPEGFIMSSDDKAQVNGVDVSPKMAFVLTSTGDAASGYIGGNPYYIDSSGNRSISMAADVTVYNESIFPNHLGRADIEFEKFVETTDTPVKGARFRLVNNETNEEAIIETDEDGFFSTASSYKAHSDNIWFRKGAQGTDETEPDETRGALPLGTYTITEVDALGRQKEEPIEIVLDTDGEICRVYDNGRGDGLKVISDMEMPDLGTTALVIQNEDGDVRESKVLPAAPDQTIYDVCEYKNLKAGEEYTLIGRLMRVVNGEAVPFTDSTGKEAVGITHFETESSYQVSRYEASGTETVKFEKLDFTGLQGESFVVYERLYLGNITPEEAEAGEYEGHYAGNNDTVEFPLIHEDIEDENQTVRTPDGHTSALSADGTKTLNLTNKVTIYDEVSYTGLEPGRTYTFEGKLYVRPEGDNRATEDYSEEELEEMVLRDDDGEIITATAEKEVDTADGSVTLEFIFDAELLTDETETLVAFEDCYDRDLDIKVFTHSDIRDVAQTVYHPVISTQAKGTEGRTELLYNQGEFTDTVSYINLEPGKKYRLLGIVMDKETEEPLILGGKTVTATGEYTADGEVKENGGVDGKFDLVFNIPEHLSKELEGKDIVVYETLLNEEGTEIARHHDLTNKLQELIVPKLETTLIDEKTRDHIAYPDEEVELIDTVEYSSLISGKTYKMTGTLMNKSTGKEMLDENGKVITASETFTASDTGSGTVKITFKFNAKILHIEGESIVAFEEVTPTDGSIPVGAHTDIQDEDQTVHIPDGGTTATDSETKDHIGRAAEEVTFIDVITYKNLIPGKEYTASGILMDKETNKPVTVDGKEIANTVKFTPEEADGEVEVPFTFNSLSFKGKSIVVFEDVLYNDTPVFIEHDIEDEGQTIDIPEIGTKATANGKKEVQGGGTIAIVDAVSYKNLVPGKEYTVKGVLMNKSTGEELLVNGKQVTAEQTFTPTVKDGTVTMTFTFDSKGIITETDVVVFERLYHNSIEVTTHTDLDDDDQTVKITPPGAPPKTGDRFPVIPFAAALIISVGCIVYIIRRKRER